MVRAVVSADGVVDVAAFLLFLACIFDGLFLKLGQAGFIVKLSNDIEILVGLETMVLRRQQRTVYMNPDVTNSP